MKNLGIYLLIPLVLLGLLLLSFLLRFAPRSWRTALLGLTALLISMMPANAVDPDKMITCYEPVIFEDPSDILMMSQPWQDYRTAYLDMLDYMVSVKYNAESFEQKEATLIAAEDKLNQMVGGSGNNRKVLTAINDGMDSQLTSYNRENSGVTCYKMAISPEIERKFALSDVVRQQMALRRLLLSNMLVSAETVRLIKEGMFETVKKYFNAQELALYKRLMIDLVDMPE